MTPFVTPVALVNGVVRTGAVLPAGDVAEVIDGAVVATLVFALVVTPVVVTPDDTDPRAPAIPPPPAPLVMTGTDEELTDELTVRFATAAGD